MIHYQQTYWPDTAINSGIEYWLPAWQADFDKGNWQTLLQKPPIHENVKPKRRHILSRTTLLPYSTRRTVDIRVCIYTLQRVKYTFGICMIHRAVSNYCSRAAEAIKHAIDSRGPLPSAPQRSLISRELPSSKALRVDCCTRYNIRFQSQCVVWDVSKYCMCRIYCHILHNIAHLSTANCQLNLRKKPT